MSKTPEVSRNQRELMKRSRETMERKEREEFNATIGAAIHYKPGKVRGDDTKWDFTDDNVSVRD